MMTQSNRTGTLLGCIADDHTGASDIAGLLARSGYEVSLRLGVPPDPPTDTAAFEVIALKIRNLPADQAIAQARAALAWLQAAGATRFFWKYCSTFDSTATGNIGPVAEALMADLGTNQTIYCPAFPENQRTVYMGHLFVGDLSLAESPMKDHPLTPMRDSNLMRLLAPQVTRQVGLANGLRVAAGAPDLQARLAELRSQSTAHIIVDAVSNADLKTIATACMEMRLITGGSALAMQLPELYQQAGLLGDPRETGNLPTLPTGQIVLSGSCSDMTRQQVDAYLNFAAGYQLDPIRLSKDGPQDVRNWLASHTPDSAKIIYATAAPDAVQAAQTALGAAKAGAIIEKTLARLATDARDLGTGRFVVAGGETSGAITSALGITRLTIGREIVPGVPWTYSASNGAPIALALKSGNFGQPDFFRTAFESLNQP